MSLRCQKWKMQSELVKSNKKACVVTVSIIFSICTAEALWTEPVYRNSKVKACKQTQQFKKTEIAKSVKRKRELGYFDFKDHI